MQNSNDSKPVATCTFNNQVFLFTFPTHKFHLPLLARRLSHNLGKQEEILNQLACCNEQEKAGINFSFNVSEALIVAVVE